MQHSKPVSCVLPVDHRVQPSDPLDIPACGVLSISPLLASLRTEQLFLTPGSVQHVLPQSALDLVKRIL